MRKTVNQILDYLLENCSESEIEQNERLNKIRNRLIEIKNDYPNGGLIKVDNTTEIMTKIDSIIK